MSDHEDAVPVAAETAVTNTEKKSSSGSSQSEDLYDKKTLFVRLIPTDVTSEQLSDFFSQFCPVKHAVVVTDNEKKSRGFGFVSFSLDEDTETALQKARKSKLNGTLLRIDLAKRRDRKDKVSGAIRERPSNVQKEEIEKRKARLIIRNLPWSVRDPEQLKKLFVKYGAVTDAIIPRKKGGRMSGFGFVTLKKNSSAEKAIKESKGLKIDGREVAVDYALEKSKWLEYKDQHAGDESEEEEDSDDEDDEDKLTAGQQIEDQDSDDADIAEEDENDSEDPESDEEVEEEEEEKPRIQTNRQENWSVFVRNIPYDTDEEDLKEHFTKFGAVKYALPVIDKETGLAKGTAFVAFYEEDAYNKCIKNAPDSSTTSMLISDDVSPEYVFEGRILSITGTVDRERAAILTEKNAKKRTELLGKTPAERDRRNLYLLNEGRITQQSRLAALLTPADLEIREKSYKLRVQHLNKNPALHLSMTRLAIRNLPRAMSAKALKALGRKAVVQFATEVRLSKRQPLTREELNKSNYEKQRWLVGDEESKRSKKQGVIRQAKIIMEVKGSGDTGRSRGYGFLEFRDHKSALMGLRWLNAHTVTRDEIYEGLSEEEKKVAQAEKFNKRILVVEFAIEHANIIKRRREKMELARKEADTIKRRREGKGEDENGKQDGEVDEDIDDNLEDDDDDEEEEEDEYSKPAAKKQKKNDKKAKKKPQRKGNLNKGPQVGTKSKTTDTPSEATKSGLDEDTKKLIGLKRKRKQRKGK
jgi:nucleolar protein 4